MAITSAKAITSATMSCAFTSFKAIRSAYMYGNNTNHTQRLEIIKKNLVEAWYSLEQYIGFEGRQAFIHYCRLHQVLREPEN